MSPTLKSGVFAFISLDGEYKPAWEDVVAAIREPDHIFVPHEQASAAMAVLVSLQEAAADDRPR